MADLLYLPNINDPQEVQGLLTIFFDGKKLKKEKLRDYILGNLQEIKKQLEVYLKAGSNEKIWLKVKDLAASKKDKKSMAAVLQIVSLPRIIDNWIRESVISKEKFEFFVLCKAAEISSGDKDRDYYYALKIRNDQLLAFLYVCTESLNNVATCMDRDVGKIMESEAFKFFKDKEVQTRVFEMAELLYRQREKMGELN